MPLLENPERYSKLLTSLKSVNEDVTYDRQLSPFECSQYILELISDLGDETLALHALPIKKDMFENFKRLQKIPKEYQYSIVWKKSTDIGVVLSAAWNIAKLDNVEDKKNLFQAALDYKFTKDETDHIVRLKNATPEKSVQDCIEEIKNFRPILVPSYYVVLYISNEILDYTEKKSKTLNKNVKDILKKLIEEKISHSVKSLVTQKNNLAILLDSDGFKKFESLKNKNKLDDRDLLPFFIGWT